jgi:hypothetical protein
VAQPISAHYDIFGLQHFPTKDIPGGARMQFKITIPT